MMKYKGKYNQAIIYSDIVDPSAMGQIEALCDTEYFAGSKIRIMPDVHGGRSCAIGTTMTIKDKVIPAHVGVDIGCAILTVKLKDKRVNLPELDKFIRKKIPYGRITKAIPHKYHTQLNLSDLICLRSIDQYDVYRSLCSLGSGNHFLSVEKDKNDNLYLLIHTGSRHPGFQVADHYQKLAYQSLGGDKQDEIPYDLAFLEGKDFKNYLHDMKFMQDFAALNRKCIADDIIKGMHLHEDYRWDTVHNYIDFDSMILRKGACSAKEGEQILIPVNMRDGSIICRGKGNPDWNYSAPHGAGRLYNRNEAKQQITLNQYQRMMQGIYSTCIKRSTIDEAPTAYKPLDHLMKYIGETADVVEQLKPIYNFKAA